MSVNDERVRGLITQEAADWFIANRAGLGARERQDFSNWLKASPAHVEEYLALSVISGDLRAACADSQDAVDELVARARLDESELAQPLWPRVMVDAREGAPSRWRIAVAVVAFALGSLGLSAWWSFTREGRNTPAAAGDVLHFETRHGEQQTWHLVDHSVLHLNTDSAVTIRYGRQERRIVLNAGEALFEVAHEPDRAFRVFAGAGEAVAIGTQFDVRLLRDSTVVTVIEGRVAVGPASSSDPEGFVQLSSGQQLSLTGGKLMDEPVTVDAQRTTAWLHRQIMFEHEPLERVASEFNRYTPKPIEIATPALRSLEISGVFATDDTEAFLAFLRSLEGVKVEVTATRIRVSQD